MNRNTSHCAALAAGTVYCVDLAKYKFQVHAYNSTGACVERVTLNRAQFDAYFAQIKRARGLVVMEACAGSYHWARHLSARGYQLKLVPAQFVAQRRIGNKTDGNDADAIFAVHGDPRVRAVPVKTLAQQDLCAEHRLRELLVNQRTQCINQLRGLLGERGCVAARGDGGFAQLVEHMSTQPDDSDITPALAIVLRQLAAHIDHLQQQVHTLDQRLTAFLAQSDLAQRIDSVFGVGPITATAFTAEYGERLERFADARQFAAGIGITPREDSSGQRRRLGAITKRGNPYLRRLLVQCAQVIVLHRQQRDDDLCLLARRLLQHKPRNTAVVAIANRLARIIYAVIKHRTVYRPHRSLTAAAA